MFYGVWNIKSKLKILEKCEIYIWLKFQESRLLMTEKEIVEENWDVGENKNNCSLFSSSSH